MPRTAHKARTRKLRLSEAHRAAIDDAAGRRRTVGGAHIAGGGFFFADARVVAWLKKHGLAFHTTGQARRLPGYELATQAYLTRAGWALAGKSPPDRLVPLEDDAETGR